MARMLSDRDSTDRHLRCSRLHMRRSRRTKGADVFAQRMAGGHDRLAAVQERRLEAETAVEDARDDLAFEDQALDDDVRTTHEQTKQHDRENPGERVLKLLFRDGGFTPITRAAAEREPDLVDRLIADLGRLADGHPLRARIEPLDGALGRVRGAAAAVRNKLQALGTVRGEEEFEQQALRKQYEANYLDARKMLRRAAAERLFPPIR